MVIFGGENGISRQHARANSLEIDLSEIKLDLINSALLYFSQTRQTIACKLKSTGKISRKNYNAKNSQGLNVNETPCF